jgi:hypothetical protein
MPSDDQRDLDQQEAAYHAAVRTAFSALQDLGWTEIVEAVDPVNGVTIEAGFRTPDATYVYICLEWATLGSLGNVRSRLDYKPVSPPAEPEATA